MIKIKQGVQFNQLTTGLLWILTRLDLLSKFTQLCPEDIYITSINDSTHSKTSKHYLDEAVDVRSHNFAINHRELFRDELERFLNIGSPCPFRVLLENSGTPNEHFHVQVKKGYRCP